MKKILFCTLFLLVGAKFSVFSDELTVVMSGETHGMLYPCDCPAEPGGGLAQRAYLLKNMQKKTRILLDAGGFAAGGIYDTYTEGRVNDSIRTIRTIQAMGKMDYDAVAVGDDDLQYGGKWLVRQAASAGLPLVSANCLTTEGSLLTAPYVIVERGGQTYGVTSVVNGENLFPLGEDVVIADPSGALEKIWKELQEKSDHQIILSHLGEEETASLLKEFPDLFLAGNGHRKSSSQPVFEVNNTPVLNFGFQGKRLSHITLGGAEKKDPVKESGWLEIDGMEIDSTVEALLSGPMQEKATSIDLYIMSLCPYGLQAVGDLAQFLAAFPDAQWNVWFIGDVKGEKLNSLRGEQEVKDEMLWLGVKALHPSRYAEFIFRKASGQKATSAVIREMGLNREKIDSWVEKEGYDALKRHYIRSNRLNVDASPTVYVNNVLYEKSIGNGRLVWEECTKKAGEPAVCDSVPECLDDSDCRKEGKLGSCEQTEGAQRAKCVFRDDAQFTLTVLVADSTLNNPEEDVLSATVDMLPGAQVEKVSLSSSKGGEILDRYKPQALPFFIFDKEVAQAQNFSSMENVLQKRENCFVFKEGAVEANYYPFRPEISGSVELLVDPLMSDVGRVLEMVLGQNGVASRVTVRPLLLKEPSESSFSALDKMRREEGMRWLLLSREYPDSFQKYLTLFSRDPATSFWFLWLEEIGVQREDFFKKAEEGWSLIDEHWKKIRTLSLNDPVVLLVDNRMTVSVSGESEFQKYLGIVGKEE